MKSSLIIVTSISALLYVCYVLALVIRSPAYTRKQKLLQTSIILLAPVLGAFLIHAFYRTDNEIPLPKDKDFISLDEPNA